MSLVYDRLPAERTLRYSVTYVRHVVGEMIIGEEEASYIDEHDVLQWVADYEDLPIQDGEFEDLAWEVI